MVIFHCYVSSPEGKWCNWHLLATKQTISESRSELQWVWLLDSRWNLLSLAKKNMKNSFGFQQKTMGTITIKNIRIYIYIGIQGFPKVFRQPNLLWLHKWIWRRPGDGLETKIDPRLTHPKNHPAHPCTKFLQSWTCRKHSSKKEAELRC